MAATELPAPPRPLRSDPFPNYSFCVLVDGFEAAQFSECSGLEMTVKFDEVREGGENGFVHKLPGRIEYGNLVLKHGFPRGGELHKWCLRPNRRKVTVQLMNQKTRTPVMQWVFDGAYPVKWSGPSFKASENAIAIETLELAHRGLLVVQAPGSPM
jgi:phage tail-like protein